MARTIDPQPPIETFASILIGARVDLSDEGACLFELWRDREHDAEYLKSILPEVRASARELSEGQERAA